MVSSVCSGSSRSLFFWGVALAQFFGNLPCLCDGETLGSQGSDMLLSGGGEVGVGRVLKVFGSCFVEIDVQGLGSALDWPRLRSQAGQRLPLFRSSFLTNSST